MRKMKKMTNREAQWAAKTLRQLLVSVRKHLTTEAWLMRQEAQHMARVARELRRG
jgi:hypothetical protein